MSWAYVVAVAFGGRGKKLFIPAVLLLGCLPDIDLLFEGFGVAHRTFLHSIIFWIALFIPAFVNIRWRAVPYLAAVLQHVTFGDFFIGGVMLFWPLDNSFYGVVNTNQTSFHVGLEIVGFLAALSLMYYNGDLERLASKNKENVLMIAPLLAVVTSLLFFAVHWELLPLITYIRSSTPLTTLVVTHLILTILLAISTLQGFRKLQEKLERRIDKY